MLADHVPNGKCAEGKEWRLSGYRLPPPPQNRLSQIFSNFDTGLEISAFSAAELTIPTTHLEEQEKHKHLSPFRKKIQDCGEERKRRANTQNSKKKRGI